MLSSQPPMVIGTVGYQHPPLLAQCWGCLSLPHPNEEGGGGEGWGRGYPCSHLLQVGLSSLQPQGRELRDP